MNNEYYKELEYKGIHKGNSIQSFALKREFSLTKRKVKYDIEIVTIFNTKTVSIKASDTVKGEVLLKLLYSLLRYESIYDGCFFAPERILIDGENKEDEVLDIMLSFYGGSKEYFQIQQPLDDKKYIRGFRAWEKFDRKNFYLIQMFFYASFTDGITSDLRIALFSEICEPLSKVLEAEGEIIVENSLPFTVKKIRCPNCKNEYQDIFRREPSFKDRIRAIIKFYGETIFEGENTEKLIQKIVNTRNKILHLDKEKKNFLTGAQCGFYIKKLVMLFRLIVIKKCGVYDCKIWSKTVEHINHFNENFPQCRIRNTRKKGKRGITSDYTE